MAVCTFTLEQLRSELQRTVQAELQNLRHVVSEEMQKKFDQAGLACPRGDAGDRSCSNVKQHGEATAPAMLQCPGKAAAIAMPEVHALCDEAPARPAPELQRSANHGMMPGSDESERMLQLSDGHERKHTHHGSKKTFTPAGKAALQVNAHATTGSSTLFETLSHYAFLLIAHYAFDYASALLVILNATWIGYQTDYIATTWAETKPGYFKTGDNLFCLLAVIEVMIRMTAEGCDFFVGQGWRWNWFDLILAGSQVVDVASCILFPGGGQNEALRLLRVCKLVRIARIARIAAAFPQLHVLIASVVDSMSALFWTLLLICAFLFAVSIAITQVVNEHKMEHGLEYMEAHQESILEYYGSLPDTMLSLYMVISEGIHWSELMEPLAEHVSPYMKIVFVVFVAFQLFAMMNVITAIFVDNAMKIAGKEERDQVLSHLWTEMSTAVGVSGCVTPEVFAAHFESPPMQRFLELTGAEAEDADTVFKLIDGSGDGELDASEFITCCARLVGPARALQAAQNHYGINQIKESIRTVNESIQVTRYLASIAHPMAMPSSPEGKHGQP